MRWWKAIFAALFPVLAPFASAQGILSYVGSVPQTSTNWSSTITLPGFDSTVGTLTRVQLTFSPEAWQTLQAENLDPVSEPYSLQGTVTIDLNRLNGPTLLAPNPVTLARSGTLGAFDGNLDFGGSSGVTFTQDTPLTLTTSDANFSAYLDKPSVTFQIVSTGTSKLTGGGNVAEQATSSAAAQLTVAYSYSPIPEPEAIAAYLAGGALVLVSARAARRRLSPAA